MIYVIHMMIAVPMLVLEVPFAKWAHLAYRPVVLFLMRVKADYEAENAQPVLAAAHTPPITEADTPVTAGGAEAVATE